MFSFFGSSQTFNNFTGELKIILFFIVLSNLVGCSGASHEKVLDYEVSENIDRKVQFFAGSIIYGKKHFIYPMRIKEPIFRLNIKSGKKISLGGIGSAPGEYWIPAWITEFKEDIYLADKSTGKLQVFDSTGDFKREVGVYNIHGKFKFLNDSLIVILNPTIEEIFFRVYDIKNKKEVLKFGESIEYPYTKYRTKLPNRGRHRPYRLEWDVRDSLLVWYDYYHDKLLVYNIFNGKLERRFGRTHRGWSVPKAFLFKGDAYHKKSWTVPPTPCRGLQITDKYIYIVFLRLWLYGWGRKNSKNMWKSDFILVDVYSREDFSYLGSFYPLNKYTYNKKDLLRLDWMDAEDDSLLNFYLIDVHNGNFFRKIKVKIKSPS